MMMMTTLQLPKACVLFALCVAALAAPEVKLGRTKLLGLDLAGSNVDFFGGIPFAEPPTGALRFRSPILKTRLNATSFDAGSFGKSCLQPPLIVPVTDVSEDCLTVNIHRPSGTKEGAKLPVLFWTYGGGFAIGGASVYNGSELVARSVKRGTPIIYVNFNYRLGPIGFPQGQEADDRDGLNLALKDQVAALKWVQANIDVFGGDKDKVTIFGESAGAIMTSIQQLSPDLAKLARGAILESGTANGLSLFKASERETSWQGFVRATPSCAAAATSGNTFPCLQNATSAEILAAYLQVSGGFSSIPVWAPTLDSHRGSLLPDFPSRLYAKGHFSRIPFIAGTNLDEGTLFATAARSFNTTEADLKASLIAMSSPSVVDPATLESSVDKVLNLYPQVPALGSPYNTGEELFGLPLGYKRTASILGDMIFDATRRLWTQSAAKFGVKTYGYKFSQPQPLGDPAVGVSHGSEVAFVYGSSPDQAPSAQKLSIIMMDYWISFTVSLNPNDKKGDERPNWPQYTSSNQALIQLKGDNTTVINDDFRKEQLDFFNSNALVFRH